MNKQTFYVGVASLALVATGALFTLDADYKTENVSAIQQSASNGYVVGEVYQFERTGAIDLVSDRRNLSTTQRMELPAGFVIEAAELIPTKRRHTVKYTVSYAQPNSVSIHDTVSVQLSNAVDQAHGLFDGKRKIEALASVSRVNDAIKATSFVDAGSHARVTWHGWADGRRWSSKDGVIKADLKVTARYVGTAPDIEKALIDLAKVVASKKPDTISAAVAQLEKRRAENSKSDAAVTTAKADNQVENERSGADA